MVYLTHKFNLENTISDTKQVMCALQGVKVGLPVISTPFTVIPLNLTDFSSFDLQTSKLVRSRQKERK